MMARDDQNDIGKVQMSDNNDRSLVIRSSVPPALSYTEYRKFLRPDFLYSCAYCTMCETEAHAIRFVIDHYEPRKARPDLENDYANLMYACDECNTRKGDRTPHAQAREQGVRFFRPDQDRREDHFESSGLRVKGKTPAGNYSVDALDLNRHSLLTLREIRRRLSDCEKHVYEGVMALRNFSIDRLPQEIKGRALQAKQRVESIASQLPDDIDEVLRNFARSQLLGDDEPIDTETKERKARLHSLEALLPGEWRAPRSPRRKS